MHVRHFATIRDRFVRGEARDVGYKANRTKCRDSSSVQMTGLVGTHIATSNGEILLPDREMQIGANRVIYISVSQNHERYVAFP